MRPFLAILLFVVGCSEASAKSFRARGERAVNGAGGAPADNLAVDGAGQTWTFGYDGTGCVASPNWNTLVPTVGNTACTVAETARVEYTCGQSTSGLSDTGIGSSRVGKGILHGSLNGADWSTSSPCASISSGIPDGSNYLFRMIFKVETGAWTGNNHVFQFFQNASNFARPSFQSNESWASHFASGGTTYSQSTSANYFTTGTWYIIDYFYNGTLTNPQHTICKNGTCTAQTAAGSNLGGIGTLASFSFLGNGSIPVLNITWVFAGFAMGSDSTWWSTTKHATDCAALGLSGC